MYSDMRDAGWKNHYRWNGTNAETKRGPGIVKVRPGGVCYCPGAGATMQFLGEVLAIVV